VTFQKSWEVINWKTQENLVVIENLALKLSSDYGRSFNIIQ